MGLGTAGSCGLVGALGTADSFLSVCPEACGAKSEASGGTCEAPEPAMGGGGSGGAGGCCLPEVQCFGCGGRWPDAGQVALPGGQHCGLRGPPARAQAARPPAGPHGWRTPQLALAQKLAPSVWVTSLLMVTLGTNATSGALGPDCVTLPLACIKSNENKPLFAVCMYTYYRTPSCCPESTMH